MHGSVLGKRARKVGGGLRGTGGGGGGGRKVCTDVKNRCWWVDRFNGRLFCGYVGGVFTAVGRDGVFSAPGETKNVCTARNG